MVVEECVHHRQFVLLAKCHQHLPSVIAVAKPKLSKVFCGEITLPHFRIQIPNNEIHILLVALALDVGA